VSPVRQPAQQERRLSVAQNVQKKRRSSKFSTKKTASSDESSSSSSSSEESDSPIGKRRNKESRFRFDDSIEYERERERKQRRKEKRRRRMEREIEKAILKRQKGMDNWIFRFCHQSTHAFSEASKIYH
jgi:hypothetical protein